ncbi:sensor histidine kinase [Limnohabitans sp.]|uniref:sensor histidine kinase n=1 Tax=Limnohabitans sp. TaxID=1907725 RepID=UPI00286EEECB|nr:sensor histidine kinase [Limnohabitans sp.]
MSEPSLSLRRQLLLWLLLPQLVLWLGGGALTYRIARNYAEKGLDQSLMQSVRSLARQVKPLGSGLLVDFPRAAQAIIEEDPADRVSYMVSSPPGKFLLGNQAFAEPPSTGAHANEPDAPVFYRMELAGKPMRAVSLEAAYGDAETPQRLRVQLAKSYVARERIAEELIADLLAPLLLLGVVLSILVYAGIKRGMAPLTKLEKQLQERSVSELTPLELTTAPTEVHALVASINRLLLAVRRNVSQEKRFINDAAHQLRTPLAGIINQTELALNEPDASLLKARLHKVHAGAQRSAHLVNQLLALARSGTEVPMTHLDLASLAQDVARELSPRAVAQKVDLGYEGDAHVWVNGSVVLLREAITNVIDNALRYGAVGVAEDGTATITVSVRQQGQDCVLAVEDNGSGLSDAQREHAFDRFWRANELPGGCGLGLSIVQEIARRHGGEARVLPVLPQGLRVELTLHTAQPAS